ncbi:hypothetical protein CRM22_008568 [Opisthorchis felineus]|uniref:Uncharacterized protein n=3 Tax=Opisthorchis felineus TaxID=147828 RepID=A0A4S2LAL5_OPIFE|nr:hypothetical protein CRM22_008568 [Opisthorchis felineus]
MDLKNLPSSERAKIASLLSKDKAQNDIEWMYNPSKEDSEAYLLGKEVSDVEHLQKLGKDYEESASQRLARIDMETKVREDPLTIMKQREAEKRIELLRNTAKVKKLRRLITMQKLKNEKKRKQKKARRHARPSRSRSSSNSSSTSSSDELLDKFIKIVRQSDEHEKVLIEKGDKMDSQRSPEAEKRSYHQPSTSHTSSNDRRPEKRKLSKQELEERRAQMMSDAKEHEKDRSVRTSYHYQKKLEYDKRDSDSRSRHGPSFIADLKNDHAQRSSIEEGVHRKAGRRQGGEMNSNFLRR